MKEDDITIIPTSEIYNQENVGLFSLNINDYGEDIIFKKSSFVIEEPFIIKSVITSRDKFKAKLINPED